ncbi:hypothetical protein EK21DRAFT_27617, partial [Setomelanomma holmii]
KEYYSNAFQLTQRSRFFCKALRGDWKEAAEKTLKLPEDSPKTFKRYLQLILTGTI